MAYIITGGCGFLGSNLAKHLLLKGHQVTLFDNLSRKGSRENLQNTFCSKAIRLPFLITYQEKAAGRISQA